MNNDNVELRDYPNKRIDTLNQRQTNMNALVNTTLEQLNYCTFDEIISLPNIAQCSFKRVVREHVPYVNDMKHGFIWPDLDNKHQVRNFIKLGTLSMLGKGDVIRIEKVLNSCGFRGIYFFPEPLANYCYLLNINQLKESLKKQLNG